MPEVIQCDGYECKNEATERCGLCGDLLWCEMHDRQGLCDDCEQMEAESEEYEEDDADADEQFDDEE